MIGDLIIYLKKIIKQTFCKHEYKNAETLKRFNLMAMKGSGMLPPDMDKKKYEDMNEEEKEIVKFFGFKPFEYDELNNSSCIKLLN